MSPRSRTLPFAATSDKLEELALDLGMANRHGLVAGATGTGKTVTLRTLTEGFSRAGVPVFLADVKGDLSGLAVAGGDNPKAMERAAKLGVQVAPEGFPVVFWDVFGQAGHPLRATVSEMGPLLLSRLLKLNDVQEGVLRLAFRVADDSGLLLLDLKDLRAMLTFVGDNAAELQGRYGNVSMASVGAIQRNLLALEDGGGEVFFGEPVLNLDDLMQTDPQGRGMVNVLVADKLMRSPAIYATALLWLLSELFENLPEVGDLEKPRLVFFFDEAHLLFDDAPKALVEKIETVVRLIRSKGVGVYFVTQSPLDVPDEVLGQLGLKVQHALRAFTPKDRVVVQAVAKSFRPGVDGSGLQGEGIERAVTELAVGEALVSILDGKGAPSPVVRTFVHPPASRFKPLDEGERRGVMAASPVAGVYEKNVDRESAFEVLQSRVGGVQAGSRDEQPGDDGQASGGGPGGGLMQTLGGVLGDLSGMGGPSGGLGGGGVRRSGGRERQGMVEAFAKSAVRAVGSQIGRQIVRGVLGSIFRGR